jgi:phosphoglycerate dehydrogenase-like enzyme
MRVHLLEKFEQDWIDELKQRLDISIDLTYGENLPDSADYEILVAGVPEEKHIEACPELNSLIIPWTGLPSSTRKLLMENPHVAVHNMHHNALPVAETAITLMMAVAKNTILVDQSLRKHDWTPRYDIDYNTQMISGKTALILGYGAIGKQIARICMGLNLKVNAIQTKPDNTSDDCTTIYTPDQLDSLLPDTNILFVALPLTPATKGLLNKKELSLLPDNTIIVNIARGRIIDEKALFDELLSGRIKAGLDVWYEYPKTEESRSNQQPSQYDFHKLDNVVMSPHMAEHTTETESKRLEALSEMLNMAATGKTMPNKIDLIRGY